MKAGKHLGFLLLFACCATPALAQTTNLEILRPYVGQPAPQTQSRVATGFDYFDAAIAGRLSKSVAGGTDATLTTTEARNKILEFTGLLTGNINVIVPTKARSYIVYNNTTGAFTLTVKTSGGTGIAVTQASRTWLYCDATNVVQLTTGSPITTDEFAYGNGSGITSSASFKRSGVNVLFAGSGAAVRLSTASPAASDGGFIMELIGGANAYGPAIRWGLAADYAQQSSIWLSNGFNFQGHSSSGDPLKIRTGTGTSSDGSLVFEFRPSDGVFNFTPSTSNTSSRLVTNVTDVSSTGTPAAGFGGQHTLKGQSSTTASQDMAAINWIWTTATHASRTSAVTIQTVDNAGSLTERARVNYWGIQLTGITFSNLGTPSDGTIAYCSDCTIANPCAGSGTGAIAKRLNSVWVCN